ncbi:MULTISPECIES: hypothetical protein [Brevibacillus]|uniref:hypothetical protein n=1 Tax=Brevibacillus TaxID=55080 RepID=UPI0004F340D5|nr:hypothetical protein [Brevibacillus borstelensis]KKX53852.1 hypothetical protein X546_15900 [Brevibacillus borstelensis cifa_chp40]
MPTPHSFSVTAKHVPLRTSPYSVFPLKRFQHPDSFASVQLNQLYHSLSKPLIERPDDVLNSRLYYWASPTQADASAWSQVQDIISFSYNYRYLSDPTQYVPIGYEVDDKSQVFTVQQDLGNDSVVLATARAVVGSELDCYDLFEGVERREKAVEFVRFSFHPILDMFPKDPNATMFKILQLHKRYIFRMLLSTMVDFAQRAEWGTMFIILPPHVKKYMAESGFGLIPVPFALPSEAKEYDEMRNTFSKYWKPGAPVEEQPALYTVSPQVEPFKKELNGYTIIL